MALFEQRERERGRVLEAPKKSGRKKKRGERKKKKEKKKRK